MRRSATERALQEADALDRSLRDRPPASFDATGSSLAELPTLGRPDADVRPLDARAVPPRTALEPVAAGAPLRLPHSDWVHHHLTIAGPGDILEAFRVAAAGSGTVPWQLDLERMQEDLFHLLAGAGQLSLEGARLLAGQMRDAVSRRHALAVARVGHSRACPFDLHALVPVPADMLCLGPEHPEALDWLWTHWGTTEALRHVTRVDDTDQPMTELIKIRFWSADWSPWRALAKIRAAWPLLRFDLRPDYGTG